MIGVEPDHVSAFASLSERHRRELHVHCYRMLASFDEAEDAGQETLLRAWRSGGEVESQPSSRAWLYRIATNVCLDMIRRKSRVVTAVHSFAEVPWLEPYPDRLLDEVAPTADEPDAVVIARETIELAFLTAMQVLPPRQRAVLILRDVFGWTASETASLLETSVPAANSALQRARTTMHAHLPPRRVEWSAGAASVQERAILEQFIAAHERCDAGAAVALVSENIRVTMPPYPTIFEGRKAFASLVRNAEQFGAWRLVPTSVNRMPAAASYLRGANDIEYRASKLDVLRIDAGLIAEITTFGDKPFPALGLPLVFEVA
jgi:RNA polymerase sigma-70 factor (TIGR02960 family)